MAVHPSEILVEQRCVNSNMFWLWSEKRNSHSVCLSNFCRNSIAVARWGGLINCWGKCDERDCRYGIQEHSKCAWERVTRHGIFFAFFLPTETHMLQLSELQHSTAYRVSFGCGLAATFCSKKRFSWESFAGHEGTVDCFYFKRSLECGDAYDFQRPFATMSCCSHLLIFYWINHLACWWHLTFLLCILVTLQ